MAGSTIGDPALHRSCSVAACLALVCALTGQASAAPGDLDRTFGAGLAGRVVMTGPVFGQALARQADGKLVVAGQGPDISLGLIRFLPDGSLDPSFGAGGTVTTSFPLGFVSVIVQTDGKIVAVTRFGAHAGVIARFETDGSLDDSFGSGGSVDLPFAPGNVHAARPRAAGGRNARRRG